MSQDQRPTAPSAAELRTWIVEEVARAAGLAPERVAVVERFRTFGVDSGFATALAAKLGRWLGRPVRPTILWEHPTIEALVQHLAEEGSSPRAARPLVPGAQDRSSGPANEPIAVVGVGCRLPGGVTSPESYWRLLRAGVDAITEVPSDRWDVAAYLDEDRTAPGKMNARRGGFIDEVDRFDAQFFGISPREAAQMDPQQRVLLELAWEALEDAGIRPDSLLGTSTGVFVGAMWSDYARLDRGDEHRIEQHTATGVDTSIIPARISYTLGLQGPSIAVNTACSSSLVAVHLACQSLRNGESSLALAGGVSLVLTPWSTVAMTKFGALSPEARCRAFDAGANGYARGEGAGLVVLKPVSRALLDRDRIYCVILGSAVNNDGFSNGLTAPNPQAQEQVVRKACLNAGVEPSQIQYVEAHGPGTLLGDPIEAHALGAVLGAGRTAENALRIGSVKTNLGHTEATAGIAGLIKVALAIKHGLLPPSLHFDEPNPHIPFEALGLKVQTEPTRWPAERAPLAGVSSFGFGGTNCHVVVSGATERARVYPVAGDHLAALRDHLLELLSMAAVPRANDELDELSRAAAQRFARGRHRVALVAATPAGLVRQVLEHLATPAIHAGAVSSTRLRTVWVCPGQGSQWLGMGRELAMSEPAFRVALEACDRAIARHAGWSVLGELFATPATSRLEQVDVVQPVLFAMQVAFAALWRSWGIEPDVIIGHSMGEIAAAHLAGVLDLDEAVRVVCGRSRAIRETAAGSGGMLAVNLDAGGALRAMGELASSLNIAAFNGPAYTVLSGNAESIDAGLAQLLAQGVNVSRLQVDYASHSSLMERLRDPLRQVLDDGGPLHPRDAAIRMVSSVHVDDLRGRECDGRYWFENLRQPVHFMQTVEKILDEGDAVFIELSPHPVLGRAIDSIGKQRGASLVVLGSGHRDDGERAAMLGALARLYELGATVAWSHVGRGLPRDHDWLLPAWRARAAHEVAVADGDREPARLFVLSAKTPDGLRAQARRYAEHLGARCDQTLADVCHSAATTRTPLEERLVIVGTTRREVQHELAAFARGDDSAALRGHTERSPSARLAFLFSGQGSQYPGMARELYRTEPVFRAAIDACAARLDARLPRPMKDVMFRVPEGDAPSLLDDTLYTQLGVFSLEYGLYALWRSWGVRPDLLLGHSLGEIVAACVAGVMSLDDALGFLEGRARLMQGLPNDGAMVAIGAPVDEVRRELAQVGATASIAAVNGASQTVASGASIQIERFAAELAARGIDVQRLRVSRAFHSELMEPILDQLGDLASRIRYHPAEIPIVSNLTGGIAGSDHARAEYWVAHARQTVEFCCGVRLLETQGVRAFVELGPQPVLLGMLDDCLSDNAGVVRLPSLRRGRSDRDTALRSLGKLWVSGREIESPDGGEPVERVDLPTYAFQRVRHWLAPPPRAAPQPPVPAASPLVHVVDNSGGEHGAAESVWRALLRAAPGQAIEIREADRGTPLSPRLRRFIEAAVARAARRGHAVVWIPSSGSRRPDPTPAPARASEAARPTGEHAPPDPASWAGRLASLAPTVRRAALLSALQEDAATILGMQSPADVAVGRPLRELGFDSLMSMELRRAIGLRLERKISPTVAFDYPTIEALAVYLLDQVLGLGEHPDQAPPRRFAERERPLPPAADAGIEELSARDTLDELRAQLDDVAALLDR